MGVNLLREQGISATRACDSVGISRSWYYGSQNEVKGQVISFNESDDAIVEKIKAIKTEHPFWGYRRVCAWLVHREKVRINKKKVYRLMKEHGLVVNRTEHRAKRTPQRSKPKATCPYQLWGIDMTKFLVPVIGWVYLVIVLDWYTKKIVGRKLSLRCKSGEWREAMEMAVNNEFPEGVRGQGLKLVSDNGSQPTSTAFMKDVAIMDIEQIFTTYDNPKGNADTERMMRTIKEEVIWINEFTSFEHAKNTLHDWIDNYYNKRYLHSSLGYMSPEEFEEIFYNNNSRVSLMAAS